MYLGHVFILWIRVQLGTQQHTIHLGAYETNRQALRAWATWQADMTVRSPHILTRVKAQGIERLYIGEMVWKPSPAASPIDTAYEAMMAQMSTPEEPREIVLGLNPNWYDGKPYASLAWFATRKEAVK